MPTAGPADDAAIREQAYYFWEQDGRPEGRESEYWMRATAALAPTDPAPKRLKAAPKAAAKPKAAAGKAKAAPAKSETAKKPKRK